MKINLDNKHFKSVDNSDNGEVSGDTLFYYSQNGVVISANYCGGKILQGSLIGKMFDDNHLEFVYQHVNTDLDIMTGICNSYPAINESGKIVLEEFWQWTCKDGSKGQSTLIEI